MNPHATLDALVDSIDEQHSDKHAEHHHVEKWRPTSQLTRAEREEMKALSKEVFGTSSKWQKLIDNGTIVKATKVVKVEEPQEDGTTKTVEKHVAAHNHLGKEYSEHKRYAYGELRKSMLDLKDKAAQMNAMFAKQQADAQAAQAKAAQVNEIQDLAGGSAI